MDNAETYYPDFYGFPDDPDNLVVIEVELEINWEDFEEDFYDKT